MNRYNGLERIVVGSTKLKRYNDSSNRYIFHESLYRLQNRYITIHSGLYAYFSILEYFLILR
jgi:hypothetical protein